LHNQELHNLYASPNIIRVIKSKMMGLVGHVVYKSVEKCILNIGQKNLKGRDHSENLSVDGRIILEWILEKENWKLWTGFSWLRIGTSNRLL